MLMTLMAWGGPGGFGDHGPGPWWPVFPILWFAVLAAAVVTFAILWRRRTPSSYAPDPTGGAVAQLAERYARGEIDEQEYQERLGVLRRERPDK